MKHKKSILCLAASILSLCIFACPGVYSGDNYQFFIDSDEEGGGNGGGKSGGGSKFDTARDFSDLTALEKDIIFEMNKFRADPVGWCNENNLGEMDGRLASVEFITDPDNRYSTPPFGVLYTAKGLCAAAKTQALKGNVAHSDLSQVRRYGSFRSWGENVGPESIAHQANNQYASKAAQLINEMIRDRGVAGKGHRVNTANSGFTSVGVSVQRGILVIQFASGWKDK